MRVALGTILVVVFSAWISPTPVHGQVGSLIVNITSPAPQTTVSGNTGVSASVTIVGQLIVAGVQFKVDGANLGAEDTQAPYWVNWDTTKTNNGSHTLTAVARDLLGIRYTSNPVVVSVFNDQTPPAITVTFPTAGSTVNNTITVTANASDNVGVAGVRFRLDGADLGPEDTTPPYSVSWDTTTASNSQHSLTAVARDSAGNTRTSNPVVVSVLNDQTPPAVTITFPTAGSTVNQTITVTADASDNVGVAGVRFRLDGADLGPEDTAPPYSVSWDTTTASNSQHSLTAVARDSAGNTTTSAAVSVVVCNPSSTATYIEETDSCISYSAGWTHDTALRPWSGGSAAFTRNAGAQATFTFVGTSVNWIGFRGPQAGIARVTLDGVFAAEVDTYSITEVVQSVVFRKTGLAAGTHTLTIEATGGKNPLATDSYVVVDAFDLTPSPIVVENQLPGSTNWQMWLNGYRNADDLNKQIKGYASATSVNKGQSITFHVTVNPAQAFTMDIYRMGWYQGLGGRFMQRVGPLNGVQQPACPGDPVTGLIECPWTSSYTLNVPVTWTSGVFLAQLTNAQGFQNYVTFVVRDDSRRADVLYQQSVTTYQAYNNFPNDGATGKSLYDYNSWGGNTITGAPRAAKASFNRPYNQDGSGQFLLYEYYFVRWLERSGYDVTYSTDLDTHQQGARLLNHRAFLSVGHDEYWSKAMYDAAEQARDAGIHLAFFEANAVYWQVRFEPSPVNGVADRVMVCYKDPTIDPVQGATTTVLWRDPLPNRPEQRLIGVQFAADHPVDNPNFPYVVSNSSNWVYAGTGLIDGSQIPGIVGYEIDSYTTTAPPPPAVAGTYAILSQSPFVDDRGVAFIANSSIYQALSGAWVFGAGTIGWSWGLDYPGVADPRIQRTTANILHRFLGLSLP